MEEREWDEGGGERKGLKKKGDRSREGGGGGSQGNRGR